MSAGKLYKLFVGADVLDADGALVDAALASTHGGKTTENIGIGGAWIPRLESDHKGRLAPLRFKFLAHLFDFLEPSRATMLWRSA